MNKNRSNLHSNFSQICIRDKNSFVQTLLLGKVNSLKTRPETFDTLPHIPHIPDASGNHVIFIHIIKYIYIHSSCEIEDFVEARLCNLYVTP